MVYHCIFLRMSDLPSENMLLPWFWRWLTIFSLHYGYILDHEYRIKKDHETTMGNHAQPWKHVFHNSWVVNKSSISFSFITKVAKKNSRLVVCSRQNHSVTCKKALVLEERLLDLHHHIVRLDSLIQEYLFSIKM